MSVDDESVTVSRDRSAHRRLGAVAFVVGAGALWSLIESVGGVLSRSHPPLQTVWLRYAAHVTTVLIAALPRTGRAMFATGHIGLQVLRGLCMFVMPVAFLLGVARAPATDVWGVFWAAPVLVLAVAQLLLGERPRATLWISALVGLVGALLALAPGLGVPSALLPGGLMAASFAGYLLLSRVLRDEPLSTSLFYTGVGALMPLCLLLPWIWTPLRLTDAWAVLALGAASVLFLASLDRASGLAESSFIAPLLYLVLPFEAALTAVLHQERPAGLAVVGLGAICLATTVVALHSPLRSPMSVGRRAT